MAELLIKNGRIYDPVLNMDEIADVVIENGIIKEIGKNLDVVADTVIDANGFLVSAGWIDIHGHLYEGSTPNGLPTDMTVIPMGVTAIADAGSSGVANYPNLLKYLRNNKVRGRLMLNVSACGIIMPSQFPEPVDPKVWDIKLFQRAKELCGDDFIGLKIRVSSEVVKELGLEPLKKAVEAANEIDTRVIVHVTNPPSKMSEIADCLRPGDVFCHVYHGTGNTIFGEDGEIEEGILAARERGVIFDAATGRGNYSFDVARKAIEKRFLPDTISTDVSLQNWNHKFAGQLPMIMSKYLPLGMSVAEVIERVTAKPAEQFGMAGLGTMKVGTPADITVFALEEKSLTYKDKFGVTITTKQIFVPKATIIDGVLQYRSVDCPSI